MVLNTTSEPSLIIFVVISIFYTVDWYVCAIVILIKKLNVNQYYKCIFMQYYFSHFTFVMNEPMLQPEQSRCGQLVVVYMPRSLYVTDEVLVTEYIMPSK